jgi:quinolinate synthase|tara:strand:- start:2008 stop:2157 length:150 start_codon:yes stop_codon:yes gene_type:complete
MAMNGLENTLAVLEDDNGCGQEIFVDPTLAAKAMKPLDRMLEFGARLKP